MQIGLGFDTDQEELRRALRSMLSKRSDEGRVREVMASRSGTDTVLWRGLADELGCHGLTVPERWGGAGASLVEQGVVFEELGRFLACVPYAATVGLALSLLLRFPEQDLVADAATRIAAGDLVATVALCEPGGVWDARAVRMEAERTGSGWTLSGTKTYVPDGHEAGLILVLARIGTELAVLAVDGEAPGLVRTQLPTMDQTRRQARLDFAGTPARLLATGADGEVDRALAQSAALLAVEQVGSARRVLEGTTEYAKVRTQFGAPIGSFQAVKHRLADMLLDVEAARSAAYYALFAAAADDEELMAASSLAKAFCSDALVRVCEASVQIHGGIGLTWEHWAHLYFKRARSAAVLLGDAAQHRERLACEIGL
ncbi:acyl-CoA dehydrogenase [Actinomadura sp. LD22]|uniref:Acyl-CoA dehydrogenase n=1 Tax=Actinomadura physcomitrii TaxID=2650748 RepID=A0A6I4MAV9_9ACTN|nr:acyl-CoA dehydrogenase family protein [Actinomadura physcomitrii]MWA02912.1 acyl-CoA dehydrogenase [Actinomadura physcomitrii]